MIIRTFSYCANIGFSGHVFHRLICYLNWPQEDFFGELHKMLSEMPEVTELHPVPDAYVPVMKFKFNGVSIDLLYAKLSLWVIPDVSDFSNINTLKLFHLTHSKTNFPELKNTPLFPACVSSAFCLNLVQNVSCILPFICFLVILVGVCGTGLGCITGVNITKCR